MSTSARLDETMQKFVTGASPASQLKLQKLEVQVLIEQAKWQRPRSRRSGDGTVTKSVFMQIYRKERDMARARVPQLEAIVNGKHLPLRR